ncbi:hypothetical protein MNBD_BACTEROID05-9, partial [hydrothermal vent metagenome]
MLYNKQNLIREKHIHQVQRRPSTDGALGVNGQIQEPCDLPERIALVVCHHQISFVILTGESTVSKNRNRYIGIVLLGICVVGILSTGNAYSQKKVITIKKSRNAYQSRYDILRKEYHPDIQKLLKLNATFTLQGKGETASFFLGCSFNYADGILVDLKPGILKLLQREPKVYGLGMSSNTGDCDGCTERLDFNHSILKDLPRLTQLRSVTLGEIDFRDAKQYKYIQPLKNLQRLGFSSCAVSI